MLDYCPEDCGKKTFCHPGQPLPYDKSVCYSEAVCCDDCGLPKFFKTRNGLLLQIPTSKETEQYWRGKVCHCLADKQMEAKE